MRIDHVAYRTKDRNKTAKFFVDVFGYKISEEFEVPFEDGNLVKCLVLTPPEKTIENAPWSFLTMDNIEYHMAPEIFVSDGESGSIVKDWVDQRGGIGGIHHVAMQVQSVEQTMKEWKEKGYAEFTTDEPLSCDGLKQVFTKPSELTGVIYELIERTTQGFCKDNVKDLMNSTKNLI